MPFVHRELRPHGAAPDVAPADALGITTRADDELDATLRLTVAGAPGSPAAANLVGLCLGAEADTVKLLQTLVAGAGREPQSASYQHLPFRAAK